MVVLNPEFSVRDVDFDGKGGEGGEVQCFWVAIEKEGIVDGEAC